MDPTLKLILFFIFLLSVVIVAYKAYKYCNEKILESSSGWHVLGFSLLLILINLVLLIGGLYALITSYSFLAELGLDQTAP